MGHRPLGEGRSVEHLVAELGPVREAAGSTSTLAKTSSTSAASNATSSGVKTPSRSV